mgnify:CR=1 FL=1
MTVDGMTCLCEWYVQGGSGGDAPANREDRGETGYDATGEAVQTT